MTDLPGRLRPLAVAAFDRLDPTLPLARRRFARPAPQLAVALVYRRRNAPVVRALMARHPGARFALWALDEAEPSLAAVTVGTGPGVRFALLNALVASLAPQPHEWLAISDDDVALGRGSLQDAAAIAHLVGLDLVQPAHGRASFLSWPHNKRQPLVLARAVDWVEIGPVVLFDAAAREHVLPFPENGMGWGVELEWADTVNEHGLRLGIVDAVHMTHLTPAATAYDSSAEQEHASDRQASRGYGDAEIKALMATRRRWRAWSRP